MWISAGFAPPPGFAGGPRMYYPSMALHRMMKLTFHSARISASARLPTSSWRSRFPTTRVWRKVIRADEYFDVQNQARKNLADSRKLSIATLAIFKGNVHGNQAAPVTGKVLAEGVRIGYLYIPQKRPHSQDRESFKKI